MDGHREIENQAAALLAKRDSGDWSERDQAQLIVWLDAATAHRVAFLRLESAWDAARRLKAVSAGVAPVTVPPPGVWRGTPFFESGERFQARYETARPPRTSTTPGRFRRWGTGLAASVVLAAIGSGSWYLWSTGFWLPGDRFSTPIGGMSLVPLKDGSKVTLNTASEVRIELTSQERHINLERGEAFFEVAKDPSRPFVVQVGDKRVVAVGTKFSVSRDGDDVRVVVTEGTVRLESTRTPSHGKVQHRDTHSADARLGAGTSEFAVDSHTLPLTAGTIAMASEEDVLVQKASIRQAEEALSWRVGYLTFNETTLADAVAEFNRYNDHKIIIDDSNVASIRISGTFRPTNYEAFVRLLHDGFAIQAKAGDKTTRLTRE
jgi:transmembrane sensor